MIPEISNDLRPEGPVGRVLCFKIQRKLDSQWAARVARYQSHEPDNS